MDHELRELLSLFMPFKRLSDRFERGTVDLERPKSEIARLTKELRSACEQMDGERLAGLLIRLLREIPPFAPKVVFATRPRPQGASVGVLCDYLEAIDRQVPMLTSIVHGGSAMPTLQFLEHWMTAQARLRTAATTRGEVRAQRLRVLADFLEVMYRELVTILYEIECIREPREISRGLDFGNLVEAVSGWTRGSLPGFVDRDAARIRNAAAHYHWHYDPATDLLHLQNRNKKGKVNWEDSFQLPDLYRRLRDMDLAVGQMEAALLWRSSAAFCEMFREPPLSHIFEQGVLEVPPPELAEQNQAAIAARFTTLERHLAVAGWTSRRGEHDTAERGTQQHLAAGERQDDQGG